MRRKIYIAIILIMSIGIISNVNTEENKENHIFLEYEQTDEFKFIKLRGSQRSLKVEDIGKIKKNRKIQEYLRKSKQRKSDYYLSLQNDSGNEIYSLGIGNPFEIHLQHIGYEDKNSIIIDDNSEIIIYYPSSLNPITISLEKVINNKKVTIDRIKVME